MKYILSFIAALVGLSVGAHSTQAQSLLDAQKKSESEWISYRDAYKSMLWFEKYGKSKSLIQNRFQIIVKDRSVNLENHRLTLNAKNSVMNLSLDALGQTQLPLLKAAYDENAEISLSPKIGNFGYRSRVSVQIRTDGNYDYTDLKQACEQTLSYLQYLDPSSVSGKKCSGIRFGFDKRDSDVNVEIRHSSQNIQILPIQENTQIWLDSATTLRVVQFNFQTGSEKTHVLTRSPPLVIVAVIE